MRRIAFVTDMHLQDQYPVENHVDAQKNWEVVLSDLKKEQISDVIIGGDLGGAIALPEIFKALSDFSVKIILGNHDDYTQVKKFFWRGDDGNALYYADADVSHHFIFMDSSSEKISGRQLDWLQTQLQTDKDIILLIHHPVLAVDTPMDKLYPLENRQEVLSLLQSSRKKVFAFTGHYHMEDEQDGGGVHQFITPAVSYQVVKNASEFKVDNTFFGYRIIELEDGKVTTRVKSFQ